MRVRDLRALQRVVSFVPNELTISCSCAEEELGGVVESIKGYAQWKRTRKGKENVENELLLLHTCQVDVQQGQLEQRIVGVSTFIVSSKQKQKAQCFCIKSRILQLLSR